jgi:hypothetical protein
MRYYKPRLREYVSTQVDMPWEFLQGVAEQKQKGFDSALAQGDAANKLLNFEVNPGDMPGKQHVQNEYNDQLYQITDYIRQTGDFSTASREFANVIRNIAQDKRIQTMTSAVDPYKKQRPELEGMVAKGELQNPWDSDWDPNYATYNPQTGQLRSYNQSIGVKTPDFFKDRKESFGDLKLSESGNAYDVIENLQYLADGSPNPNYGKKTSISISGGKITDQQIKQRAKEALFNHKKTRSYQNHLRKYNWLFANGQITDPKLLEEYSKDPNATITKLADDYSINELYIHGRDQIQSKYNQEVRQGFMGGDWVKQTRPEQEELFSPGPDASIITQDYNNVNIGDMVAGVTKSEKIVAGSGASRTIQNQISKPTKFSEVNNKYQQEFKSLYKNIYGEKEYVKVMQGKKQLNDSEINTVVTAYNNLHQGMRTNTSTAQIKDVNKTHANLFGTDAKTVSVGIMTKGLGYSENTPVYDAVNDEWTTYGEIEKGSDAKPTEYFVNKRFTTQNSLYKLSGNNKRFAKGYSIVSADGKNQYIIPEKENNVSDADVLQTQIGSAIYGFPSAVPLLGENVYSVYENGTFKLGVRDNATGTYDWFHEGDPNAPSKFRSATDASKWAMSKSQ